MSTEDIEIQLWEYIDGLSTLEEQAQIKHLITTDVEWKNKYQELLAFNQDLQSNLQPDKLRADFANDVMAKIHQPTKATSTSAAFATWGIRAIAAFFIISISTLFVYYAATAGFTTGGYTYKLPEFNIDFPSYAKKPFSMLTGVIVVIFALIVVDSFFRNKLLSEQV